MKTVWILVGLVAATGAQAARTVKATCDVTYMTKPEMVLRIDVPQWPGEEARTGQHMVPLFSANSVDGPVMWAFGQPFDTSENEVTIYKTVYDSKSRGFRTVANNSGPLPVKYDDESLKIECR